MAYRDLWVPLFDMIQAKGDLLLLQWKQEASKKSRKHY